MKHHESCMFDRRDCAKSEDVGSIQLNCRDYLPSLLSFASSRRVDFKLEHLSLPRFFYGDVDDGEGCGVLVLEDLSRRGFR